MFGHVGLAFATSLSGLVTALIMVRLLIQQNRLGLRWVRSLGRILAASLIMAAFISGLQYIGAVLESVLPNAVWLAFLVVGGAVSYAGAARITGAVPAGILGRFGIGKA